MTDPTNDIDALLEYLTIAVNQHWIKIPRGVAADYHAAITALVAERDALKAQCDKRFDFATIKDLVVERDGLAKRVAELESHPPADRDRELRKDLICAALTGLCADPRHDVCEEVAVAIADRTLAAMRKGESDGK